MGMVWKYITNYYILFGKHYYDDWNWCTNNPKYTNYVVTEIQKHDRLHHTHTFFFKIWFLQYSPCFSCVVYLMTNNLVGLQRKAHPNLSIPCRIWKLHFLHFTGSYFQIITITVPYGVCLTLITHNF